MHSFFIKDILDNFDKSNSTNCYHNGHTDSHPPILMYNVRDASKADDVTDKDAPTIEAVYENYVSSDSKHSHKLYHRFKHTGKY